MIIKMPKLTRDARPSLLSHFHLQAHSLLCQTFFSSKYVHKSPYCLPPAVTFSLGIEFCVGSYFLAAHWG